MKRSQFISIMITLITWIALTCLWAGGIGTRIENNKESNDKLSYEVEKLKNQLILTNEILRDMIKRDKD